MIKVTLYEISKNKKEDFVEKSSFSIERPKTYEDLVKKIKIKFNISNVDFALRVFDEDNDEYININYDEQYNDPKYKSKTNYNVYLEDNPPRIDENIFEFINRTLNLKNDLLIDDTELFDKLDFSTESSGANNLVLSIEELKNENFDEEKTDQNELYNYFIDDFSNKISSQAEEQKKFFIESINKDLLNVDKIINENVDKFNKQAKFYSEKINILNNEVKDLENNYKKIKEEEERKRKEEKERKIKEEEERKRKEEEERKIKEEEERKIKEEEERKRKEEEERKRKEEEERKRKEEEERKRKEEEERKIKEEEERKIKEEEERKRKEEEERKRKEEEERKRKEEEERKRKEEEERKRKEEEERKRKEEEERKIKEEEERKIKEEEERKIKEEEERKIKEEKKIKEEEEKKIKEKEEMKRKEEEQKPEKLEIKSKEKYIIEDKNASDILVQVKVKNISGKKISLNNKKWIKGKKSSEVVDFLNGIDEINIKEDIKENEEKNIEVHFSIRDPQQGLSYNVELLIGNTKDNNKIEIITENALYFNVEISKKKTCVLTPEKIEEIYQALDDSYVVSGFISKQDLVNKILELNGDMDELIEYVESLI